VIAAFKVCVRLGNAKRTFPCPLAAFSGRQNDAAGTHDTPISVISRRAKATPLPSGSRLPAGHDMILDTAWGKPPRPSGPRSPGSPLIIRDLQLGIDRFDALAENLGISRNLLTTRLAHLAQHGIVARRRYQDHPPRDRYVLTEAGQELVPVLLALTAWGDRWATPEGGPPLLFRHRRCGDQFIPTVSCDACGQPLSRGEVDALPGPGARTGPGTAVLAQALRGHANPG
jgi:DNA-binding HxlR family transcriptional regulator